MADSVACALLLESSPLMTPQQQPLGAFCGRRMCPSHKKRAIRPEYGRIVPSLLTTCALRTTGKTLGGEEVATGHAARVLAL
jgi:hypothetical protein